MDEIWLKELNKRNLVLRGEDSSKWNFAIVTVSSSVLGKLSEKEQEKFHITEFKRATNEIEHWARVEEICDFFAVEVEIANKLIKETNHLKYFAVILFPLVKTDVHF